MSSPDGLTQAIWTHLPFKRITFHVYGIKDDVLGIQMMDRRSNARDATEVKTGDWAEAVKKLTSNIVPRETDAALAEQITAGMATDARVEFSKVDQYGSNVQMVILPEWTPRMMYGCRSEHHHHNFPDVDTFKRLIAMFPGIVGAAKAGPHFRNGKEVQA